MGFRARATLTPQPCHYREEQESAALYVAWAGGVREVRYEHDGCSGKLYRCARAVRQDELRCSRSIQADALEKFVEEAAIRLLSELTVNGRRRLTLEWNG